MFLTVKEAALLFPDIKAKSGKRCCPAVLPGAARAENDLDLKSNLPWFFKSLFKKRPAADRSATDSETLMFIGAVKLQDGHRLRAHR